MNDGNESLDVEETAELLGSSIGNPPPGVSKLLSMFGFVMGERQIQQSNAEIRGEIARRKEDNNE